jgi:coatomer protein complex subunit epsilon
LKQAQDLDAENADVLANLAVLNVIQGKDNSAEIRALGKVNKDHELLVDFQATEEEFAKALEKYSPKFEV